MNIFLGSFTFSLLTYLFLTLGSGGYILWSPEEIIFAILFSIFSAVSMKKLFSMAGKKSRFHILNPKRWLLFFIYIIGPFFWNLTKANLDVASRIITGKIKPGIVKIHTGLKTDLGIALLANSITLTPGTLTVDVDEKNDLYVHCINVNHKEPKIEEVCSSFQKWAKRIAE